MINKFYNRLYFLRQTQYFFIFELYLKSIYGFNN